MSRKRRKRPRSARSARRTSRASAQAPPPTVTLKRTFKIPVEWKSTLVRRVTIPVAWTDAVVTAMRMVNAPSVSAAIRVKPKGGRPSGTYTIDKVEAVVIALAVEYGGLKPSEIIRALGLKPSVHTYHQIRYRHERGRQWITGQHVPADLRPEHLRTLTSEERTTRIHQALRALRER